MSGTDTVIAREIDVLRLWIISFEQQNRLPIPCVSPEVSYHLPISKCAYRDGPQHRLPHLEGNRPDLRVQVRYILQTVAITALYGFGHCLDIILVDYASPPIRNLRRYDHAAHASGVISSP